MLKESVAYKRHLSMENSDGSQSPVPRLTTLNCDFALMGIKDVDKVNNAGDAVDTEVACLSGDPTRASHVISSPPPLSSQKHQILNLLSDDPLYASSSFSPKAPSSGTAVLLPGKWMTKWLNAVDFKQGDEGVYVFGWEVTEEEFEVDDKEREREKHRVPPIDYSFVVASYNMIMFYDFFPVAPSVHRAFSSWYSSIPSPPPFLLRSWEDDRLILHPDLNFGKVDDESDSVSDRDLQTCACCGITGSVVSKVCSACNVSAYCSKTCQSVHWKWHSKVCGKPVHPPTRTGLSNLGNTCYANSAVQCLFHVSHLSRLFLSNSHLEHINKDNVMGTGGKLSSAFGELIKNLKFSASDYISPIQFKRTLGACFDNFQGFGQHDAHELLTTLLDGLHEDLNGGSKRYIEDTDLNEGKLAPIVGAINHDKWLIRNKSPLSPLFFGQSQNTLICPACKNMWARYEPFSCLALKFHTDNMRKVQFLFFKKVENQKPMAKPVAMSVCVSKKGTIADLRKEIAKLVDVKKVGTLHLCEIYENYFYETFNLNHPLERLLESDLIACYETVPMDNDNFIHAFVTVTNGNDAHVGFPILTSFPLLSSMKELKTHLFTLYQNSFGSSFSPSHPFYGKSDEEVAKMGGEAIVVEMYETFSNLRKRHRAEQVPWDDQVYADVVPSQFVGEYSFFNLSLVHDLDDMFDEHEAESFVRHGSLVRGDDAGTDNGDSALSLDGMLHAAQKPQRIDEDNAVYCGKCKDHRRVLKSSKIRTLPNILVISLSRFEYQRRASRVDDFVDFPLENLDMGKYCMANNETEIGVGGGSGEIPAVYDLFGVINHFGRAGYGHYTSICRNWAVSPPTGEQGKMDDQFYEFDDGAVTARRRDEVVSPQAYCLFYRKRFFT
ncbi:hypothetical protein TrRE_jg11719 [Triparma retinervis]|uniref:Ubiquitin carboxyl-terminal hydrolase n=1 Tax=Triparma retinervis TaxID=2557542 RepID=A0A9W7EFE6_9STRA|nr:hypothetical protein TrRE_jg11719 [Triparma retinervis]